MRGGACGVGGTCVGGEGSPGVFTLPDVLGTEGEKLYPPLWLSVLRGELTED